MPGSPRRASDVSSPVNSHSNSNLFPLVFPSASSVLCSIYNVSWKTRPSVCLQRFWMYTIYVSKILPLRAYKLQRILLLRFYLPLVLCFCHRCLISNIKFLNEWHICLSDKQNWLCNVLNIQSKTSEATLLSPFTSYFRGILMTFPQFCEVWPMGKVCSVVGIFGKDSCCDLVLSAELHHLVWITHLSHISFIAGANL